MNNKRESQERTCSEKTKNAKKKIAQSTVIRAFFFPTSDVEKSNDKTSQTETSKAIDLTDYIVSYHQKDISTKTKKNYQFLPF